MAKANGPIPSRKISKTLLEYAAPAIDLLPDDVRFREVEMRCSKKHKKCCGK